MNKHPITISKNGAEVYVDLISSPAAANINRQPYLISLIKEVLSKTSLKGPAMLFEHDMGHDIGSTDIVETNEKDAIFYARPLKQDMYLRCVKGFSRSPSPYITISLERDEDGNYALLQAWIGRLVPPFPADKHATKQSKNYWETHAWLADSQALQSKTITKVSPY